MMTPNHSIDRHSDVMPQEKTYDDVRQAFDSGNVVNAGKNDLEQLLLAIGRARVLHPANQARAAEMGETLRQLLAARQSQSMHSQALGTARVALWVSVIALITSLVQALAALNILAPLPRPAVEVPSLPEAPVQIPGPPNNSTRR